MSCVTSTLFESLVRTDLSDISLVETLRIRPGYAVRIGKFRRQPGVLPTLNMSTHELYHSSARCITVYRPYTMRAGRASNELFYPNPNPRGGEVNGELRRSLHLPTERRSMPLASARQNNQAVASYLCRIYPRFRSLFVISFHAR